ncbi:MAG: hypothetical protein ACYDAA_14570 [Syntrophales bacterium]
MRSIRSRPLHLTLILCLCLSAVACASLFGKYGKFIPSVEVAKELEGYEVNPRYRYYISGPDMNPNALMGLDRKYHLDPATLWREVDMSPPKMEQIVEGMKTKVTEIETVLSGFTLTDDNGRPIGIWYSILNARTFVRMNDDGTVRIDTPPLDTYESFGGDSPRLMPGGMHRY